MGFSSKLCTGCNESIISRYASNDINDWQIHATFLFESGEFYQGEYLGYWNIFDGDTGAEIRLPIKDYDQKVTCYHTDCYIQAGCPREYTTPSDWAPDQGYFFNLFEGHNTLSPLKRDKLHLEIERK